MLTIVLSALGLLTLYFAIVFFKDYMVASKENRLEKPSILALGAVGFATNFFDALGIGSFAPLTALLKQFKLTNDRTLPGTLNVSCTIPVVVEAFIFITVIKVDPITLVTMLAAATVGAILGAGFVAKLDVKKIQLGMAIALLVVAFVMIAQQFKMFPAGGDATGLHGAKLMVAIIGNFILGALMTLGIGLYAPCMALVFSLGLSPTIAFPIMMGSCAFLMPAASVKFVKEGAYDRKASMAITVCGVVGVIFATKIVKSLPLDILKWLVVVVIIYTSVMMFRSFAKPIEVKATEAKA